jgi:hypothetical protein
MLPASNRTNMEGAPDAGPERRAYITNLSPNDVLLGRGRPAVRYEGNIRFRKLVQNRKSQYRATGRNIIKDSIARELINTIKAREGRFLRKIESSVESEELGVPRGVQAWVHVDENAVLQKVKQAFRDEQRAEADNEGGASPSSSRRPPLRLPIAAPKEVVQDRAVLPSPGVAQQLSLLLNQQANRQHAASTQGAQSATLQQALVFRQELRRQDAQWQPPSLLGVFSDVNSNSQASAELMRLRAALMGGNIVSSQQLASFRQSQQQQVTFNISEDLQRLLRARALAQVHGERMRQEQFEGTLVALQRQQTGLRTLDPVSTAIGQLVSREARHLHDARERSAGTSLEQQLWVAQGRATMPYRGTSSSTSTLAQQIASTRAVQAAQREHSMALASSLPQHGANAVASSQSLAAMPERGNSLNEMLGTNPSSRAAAMDAWLRSLRKTRINCSIRQ